MPILERRNIRINPIDLPQNDKVAVGVSFPFDGPAVFNQSFTTKEQVKSNLLNLMLTSPGERLMNPNFGIGIRDLIFENVIDQESLQNRIIDSALEYVPEVEILNVNVQRVSETTSPEVHQLRLTIGYALVANDQQDAIQLNFY